MFPALASASPRASRRSQRVSSCGTSVVSRAGDRHAVEARCFLVGEQPNRVSAGARCIFDCSLRITSWQRLEEVIRELAEMRVGVVRIEILERLADSRVECYAATRVSSS